MKIKRSHFVALAILLAMSLPTLAQTVQQEKITKAELRELSARVEKQLDLPEELRTRIIELLAAATAALETAENNRATTVTYERERRGVDRRQADLKAELDHRLPRPQLALPEDPSISQAEDAVARERARLAANVSALRDQQRLADDRNKTRTSCIHQAQ